MPQRVVITGMGAVSALGMGAGPLWQGMVDARSGIVPLTSPDPETEIRMKVGATVQGFDPAQHFAAGRIALLDRVRSSHWSRRARRSARRGLNSRATGSEHGPPWSSARVSAASFRATNNRAESTVIVPSARIR